MKLHHIFERSERFLPQTRLRSKEHFEVRTEFCTKTEHGLFSELHRTYAQIIKQEKVVLYRVSDGKTPKVMLLLHLKHMHIRKLRT